MRARQRECLSQALISSPAYWYVCGILKLLERIVFVGALSHKFPLLDI